MVFVLCMSSKYGGMANWSTICIWDHLVQGPGFVFLAVFLFFHLLLVCSLFFSLRGKGGGREDERERESEKRREGSTRGQETTSRNQSKAMISRHYEGKGQLTFFLCCDFVHFSVLSNNLSHFTRCGEKYKSLLHGPSYFFVIKRHCIWFVIHSYIGHESSIIEQLISNTFSLDVHRIQPSF